MMCPVKNCFCSNYLPEIFLVPQFAFCEAVEKKNPRK